MQPSRNDPCPCQSGKKYKHCCGAPRTQAPNEIDRLRHEAFALENELIDAMDRFASRRFGRAWPQGLPGYLGLSCEPLEEAQDELSLLAFYLLPVSGRTVAEWYVEERASRLREDERRFVLAQLDAWPSLWEARDVRPGEGVQMTDLLTGEEVFVNDHNLSRSVERYHVLLGRVVKLDRIAIMGGAHPQPLPPIEAQRVVEAARRLHGRRTRPVAKRSLRSFERAARLFRIWDDAAQDLEARAAQFPQLQNTDGDPLLLTTDYFTVQTGQRERVRASIAAMEGAEPVADDPFEVVISKPGNAKSGAMPRTTIARVVLDRQLVIECNSVARADRVRAAVEGVCGDSIRHRIRKHVDPATLIRNERSGQGGIRPDAATEERLPREETARLLRDFKTRHYATWPNEQLPALNGKTPRQAMRSATGRARVEALLKHMESHESHLPEDERFDFGDIRRALGIED